MMTEAFQTELIQTADGSHTLKLKGHDEQYHSVHGAIQESAHVFIGQGLQYIGDINSSLHVLEVGMGTGLNALLTAVYALNEQKNIHYDALEPFPLNRSLLHKFNYPSIITHPDATAIFQQIHGAGSKEYENIKDCFFIRIFQDAIEHRELQPQIYHLVYFDAFGPDTQPELWTRDVFDKIFYSMKPGAVLVTYCAKGAVRRAMKEAGFTLEKLQGPPGKREMTRAVKP